MNRTRNPVDCDNYRRLKGQCQYIIKSAAKQHWQDYCNTLTSRPNTKLTTVWKQARRINEFSNTRTIPNGAELIKKEKAELPADTFSQVSSNDNYTENSTNSKTASSFLPVIVTVKTSGMLFLTTSSLLMS